MEHLESVIPHIPTENMEETLGFMVDVLGFNLSSHTAYYSELISGSQSLGILHAYGKPNHQSIYLRITDVDSLWAGIKSHLKDISFKAPFSQDYGMREAHLVIPATNTLLFIGSPKK